MKHLFLLVLALLPLSQTYGQPAKTAFSPNGTVQAKKWEVVDIAFSLKKTPPGNPFDEVFGAMFTGPGKVSLKVPGFYNGNGEWVLRFSPTETGIWQFRTYSSVGGLSGLKGIVAAGNAAPGRHGAVTVDPASPRHFAYEDGTPYFALAFELDWLFALDHGNPEGLPKTRQIMGHVKENGFNQVVMNIYAYDVNWKTGKAPDQYEFRRPGYCPFGGTNENPDFSVLNTGFFQHLDRVVHLLDTEGIVAHAMIYVWNKNVNWPPMHSTADNRYFDHVIARYQAFTNIMWDVSKEALDYGRCDIPYINERISRVRAQDAYKRLLSVHDYEYCSREADRVDFVSIQSWRSHLYPLMLDAYEKHDGKPVMNIEHGGYEEGPYLSFEGNYVNAETCLVRNYLCVFAGVYSAYYWQNTSWNTVIYDPFEEGQPFSPPRFDYYKHLATLFSRYPFNKLHPPRPKLTTNDKKGADNLATGGYPLTDGKGLYLFLIPDDNLAINTVLPVPESGKMRVTWFNIFTGEFIEEGEKDFHVWYALKSPWKKTWAVAVVEAI